MKKREARSNARQLIAFIVLFAAVAVCDPGDISCGPQIEVSYFHNGQQVTVSRDNYLASAMLVTEEGSPPWLPFFYHDNSGLGYLPYNDYLFTSNGYEYRDVWMIEENLPIDLQPGVDNIITLTQPYPEIEYARQTVTLGHPVYDPVYVIPVYTWRMVDEDTLSGMQSVDANIMKWTFDKAGNAVPDKTNYWIRERPDAIWDQCGIQFRHMGHADVPVPICWVTSAVSSVGNSCSGSLVGLNEECYSTFTSPEQQNFWDCDQQNVNLCTFQSFVRYTLNNVPSVRIWEPDAINVYFVSSFSSWNSSDGSPHFLGSGVA